jgi:ribonuclease P/MRP protein subunit POP1
VSSPYSETSVADPVGLGKKRYETGARIAHTTIHHHAQWPYGLIGPTDVLWRPRKDADSAERQVWLRFHPAMFDEVWRALNGAVQVVKSQSDDPMELGVKSTLKIEDLRGEINSFEIMGPKAGLILQGITSVCKSENPSKRKVSD